MWFSWGIIALEAIQNGDKSNELEYRCVIWIFAVEKWKPCETFRKICDVYRKVGFTYKHVYKRCWLGFATTSLSEKTVHGVKIHWHTRKEHVTDAEFSKGGHTDSLWVYKITHRISVKRLQSYTVFATADTSGSILTNSLNNPLIHLWSICKSKDVMTAISFRGFSVV